MNTAASAIQTNLFDPIDRAKQARLAAAIDAINRRNGHYTVKVAIQGTAPKNWVSINRSTYLKGYSCAVILPL